MIFPRDSFDEAHTNRPVNPCGKEIDSGKVRKEKEKDIRHEPYRQEKRKQNDVPGVQKERHSPEGSPLLQYHNWMDPFQKTQRTSKKKD